MSTFHIAFITILKVPSASAANVKVVFVTSVSTVAEVENKVSSKIPSLLVPEGSVPGALGAVKISWKDIKGKEEMTKWISVDKNKDFTKQIKLKNLKPGKRYSLTVESRSKAGKPGQALNGKFRTAPSKEKAAPIKFMVVTGQDYTRRDHADGHIIYTHMLKQNPDFFVHTGDIEYYDKALPYATCEKFARFKWNRVYGLPNQVMFHNNVASYFIKDDHDTLKNDCWPGEDFGDLTWEQGLAIFREQVPMGKKTFRTIRWGKDLQIWMVEGRDFRSPNKAKDGPNKTIWGKKQKKWFFETVKKSDASFRVLISPTPLVGPDRENKNDNHANKGFTYEGDELRKFIASQKNMFVACGDRHWQYVSIDEKTGVKEFSSGPTSDEHAGGWKQEKKLPEHKYLNVQGGFLCISVDRKNNVPILTARHYNVKGELSNEDINMQR